LEVRFRHGMWIIGLLAAALGAAAVGVHASLAAPTRASTPASTIDKTYSCPVRREHVVDLYASVTLPPTNNQPQQSGVLNLTTGVRTIKQSGITETVSQVSLQARKNSLRIDQKSCRRVKQQIPLKPKGLSGPPTTVTRTLRGYDNEQCTTTARVLFRLRVKLTAGTPTHALLAVRNDNAKHRPIAFYNWSPRKVSLYTANGCVTPG
jgi:hypothetical protein